MKYFLTVVLLCFCLSGLLAQDKHFIFIQTDNNQPFYVSLNNKLYSSTASGYIIIPKLAAGNYSFSVGFAKNAFPEQSFELAVDNKDLGFNLKNFGEKGWGLFNLQSLSVTMAGTSSENNVAKALSEQNTPKDDFEPVISFDKKKKEAPAKTKISADTISNEPVAANEKPKNEEVKSANTAITDVKKLSETKDDEGVHLSYAEDNGKGSDTILVSIPSVKSSSDTESPVANSADSEKGWASRESIRTPDSNTEDSKREIVKKDSDNAAAVVNSKCKDVATDEDFIKLRRKMAMETTDEKMIGQAKKIYRNKCFTTSQIKKLSTLFLSDEARYNFLNASYNSVSDVSQYSSLQSEFIDPAYINRFKAMLQ